MKKIRKKPLAPRKKRKYKKIVERRRHKLMEKKIVTGKEGSHQQNGRRRDKSQNAEADIGNLSFRNL